MVFRGFYTVDIHIGDVEITFEQLQTRIRYSWGTLVHDMDLSYFCQKLRDVNFLCSEDLNHLGKYSRLLQKHNILITIHKRLNNDSNAKAFVNVIQDSKLKQFAKILTFCTSQKLDLNTEDKKKHRDILETQRSILQKRLSQRDIVNIIHKFIEMSMFDIDTIERIINDEIQNTAQTFLNEVISHTDDGACQCLYDGIKDRKFCHRYVHFINAMNLSDDLRFSTSGKPSVISANMNFLIEEVEPAKIMPEFEERGFQSFRELLRQRSISVTELAKHFVSILERETVLEKPFLEILEAKEMHFILNRLTRFREVSKLCTDMLRLRKLIANKILDLVECLDIDDIKQEYIDRNIASQQMFEVIKRRYEGRTDQLIAVIIVTLNSGENAVLSLLGVLNGIPGDIFDTVTNDLKDQSTCRHNVSRGSVSTEFDSAFGSRQPSLDDLDCPPVKRKEPSEIKVSRISSRIPVPKEPKEELKGKHLTAIFPAKTQKKKDRSCKERQQKVIRPPESIITAD